VQSDGINLAALALPHKGNSCVFWRAHVPKTLHTHYIYTCKCKLLQIFTTCHPHIKVSESVAALCVLFSTKTTSGTR
jgi:hypothetical protein